MTKFNNIEKGNIIVDMDDVLVFTTSLWFANLYIHQNRYKSFCKKDIFPILFDIDRDFMYPLTRPTYYFNDWLLDESLSDEEKKDIGDLIFKEYTEDKTFYDRVDPTPLVGSLISLVKSKNFKIDKLYVVTRTVEGQEKTKLECIKRIFAPIINKVETIIVDLNEKKSDAIKDIKNIRLIIDDELKNIYDYIDNTDCNGSIMMIPIAGYNIHFDKEYIKKSEEKNISVQYYNYTK